MKEGQGQQKRSIFPSRLRNTIAYLLMALLLGWAGYWVHQHWDQFTAAIQLNPAYAIVLAMAVICTQLCIGQTNQTLAVHLGAPLPANKWIFLTFAGSFVNYLAPVRAGAVLRATYMRQQTKLPFGHFASIFLVAQILLVLTNALLGLAATLWYVYQYQQFSRIWFAAFSVVIITSVLLLCVPISTKRLDSESRFWRLVSRFAEGWKLVRRSPQLFAKVWLLTILLTLISVMRLYLAYLAVGHVVLPAGALLAATTANLMTIFAITPAGLGIREAAIVFVSHAIGITPEIALAAGGLDRAIAMAVLAVVGPLALLRVSHEMRS